MCLPVETAVVASGGGGGWGSPPPLVPLLCPRLVSHRHPPGFLSDSSSGQAGLPVSLGHPSQPSRVLLPAPLLGMIPLEKGWA